MILKVATFTISEKYIQVNIFAWILWEPSGRFTMTLELCRVLVLILWPEISKKRSFVGSTHHAQDTSGKREGFKFSGILEPM